MVCHVYQREPLAGRITLSVVKSARSVAVCSFCGARRVRDYVLPKKNFNQRKPVTFRLCDDCVHNRQKNFRGEMLLLAA